MTLRWWSDVHLDAATILLQWATGGLLFLWVTTRGRLVSLGYGWLLRGVFGVIGVGAIAAEARAAHRGDGHTTFMVGAGGLVACAAIAAGVSVVRRRAGVRAGLEARGRRRARVASMAGRTENPSGTSEASVGVDGPGRREFPPALDLLAPAFGFVGLLGAAAFTGGLWWLATARLVVGAAFLGVVSDAMLLGHWYLTQPGLPRDPLKELVRLTALIWPAEVVVMLLPPGMIGVLAGSRSDGYGGLLGWMWVVCAVTTLGLVGATWLALRERFYSAVMAATGLIYLAILTAFGTDLVARALLAP